MPVSTVRAFLGTAAVGSALALVLSLSIAGPASARVRCGNAFSGADQPGFSILANRVSCDKARRLTRQQIRGGCPATRSACNVNGFSCKRRTTGDLYRVQCHRDDRSFSWGGGS